MSSDLCCIVGCYTNVNKHKDTVLYTFPDDGTERVLRNRWIEAVKLANCEKPSWEPNSTTKVCSEHFLGNCRSLNPSDLNCFPTIFPPFKPVPRVGHEMSIDVDDSETGSDYDAEVIEETSDCLFVVGKIKQEFDSEEEDPQSSWDAQIEPETNGRKTWKPNAAKRRKIASGSLVKEERIPSVCKENGASSSKKSKTTSHGSGKYASKGDSAKTLFYTGKFSSDSSDFDLDDDEFGEGYHEEGVEASVKKFLSVADKVKVAFKNSSRPDRGYSNLDSEDALFSSHEEGLLKKKSRKKKRKSPKFPTKGSQAALPGVCDGFVFCTSRDDDFNVGVQCNIFYDFQLIVPNVEE